MHVSKCRVFVADFWMKTVMSSAEQVLQRGSVRRSLCDGRLAWKGDLGVCPAHVAWRGTDSCRDLPSVALSGQISVSAVPEPSGAVIELASVKAAAGAVIELVATADFDEMRELTSLLFTMLLTALFVATRSLSMRRDSPGASICFTAGLVRMHSSAGG